MIVFEYFVEISILTGNENYSLFNVVNGKQIELNRNGKLKFHTKR